MIVTKEKPLEEILGFLKSHEKILIVGCDGCTQPPRGLREAKTYAMLVEMGGKLKNREVRCIPTTVAKQCDNNLCATTLTPQVEGIEAILSLACGVGVQTLSEVFPDTPVYPGQNTIFIGSQERESGTLYEKCKACGDCLLAETGGICPVTRCAKGIMNGPCGGCFEGKCEVPFEVRDEKGKVIELIEKDCVWYLIYERLKKANKLDLFKKYRPPRDRAISGSPRRL